MNGKKEIITRASQQSITIPCQNWQIDPPAKVLIEREPEIILPTSRFHSFQAFKSVEFSAEEEFLNLFQPSIF